LLAAGATGFRLNTSHLTLEKLWDWLERIGAFFTGRGESAPIYLDLQGSKWRLGQFEPFELAEGQRVELICAAASGQAGVLPVPHPDFFQAAPVSSPEIVLNDARVRLVRESAGLDGLVARVEQAGPLAPAKGITYAASEFRAEALSGKDRAILAETHGLAFLRYALSYVRDAAEMARYRALAGAPAYLIAKLERQPAVAEALQVAAAADELWLCRGDLGAELGLKGMAEAVHRFSQQIRLIPVPVLLAGQVLEHMTGQPAPTRAEVCDLYGALQDGCRGFVLSDETAIGGYPIESCRAAALFKA
jgi:pyruvate kinase